MISGRREHAAHRQAVDELAVREPVVDVDRALLQERDHGERPAEGQQAGLQALPEDRGRQRDRDRAGEEDQGRRGGRERMRLGAVQRSPLVQSS